MRLQWLSLHTDQSLLNEVQCVKHLLTSHIHIDTALRHTHAQNHTRTHSETHAHIDALMHANIHTIMLSDPLPAHTSTALREISPFYTAC